MKYIEAIRSIIKATKKKLPNRIETIHTTSELCKAIEVDEWLEEFTKIEDLFSSDIDAESEVIIKGCNQKFDSVMSMGQLKAAFKSLCATREKNNQQSFLSFFSMPESACNQFYWVIAALLFQTNSIQELFEILLPSIESVLRIDTQSLHKGKLSLNRIKPLSCLGWKEANNLNRIIQADVICDEDIQALRDRGVSVMSSLIACRTGVVLNVADTTGLSLDMHCQLHHQLSTHYPELKVNLYNHNDDFVKLGFTIDIINNNGQTLKEAINSLTTSLMSVNYSGLTALVTFRIFLDSFPRRTQSTLSSLFGDLLGRLDCYNGWSACAQSVQGHLRSLLNDPDHSMYLHAKPNFVATEFASLREHYDSHHLSPVGFSHPLQFPADLKCSAISRFVIDSGNSFYDLVFSVPPEQYEFILNQVAFESEKSESDLVYLLEVLSSDKSAALIDCILKNPQLFGGDAVVLTVFVIYSREKCLQSFLNTLSESERMVEVLIEISRTKTFMHQNYFSFLIRFIKLLPPSDRLRVILHEDSANESLFKRVFDQNQLDQKISILEALSYSDRLMLIKSEHMLQHAIINNNIKTFTAIFTSLQLVDFISAVTKTNRRGVAVLHLLADPCWIDRLTRLLSRMRPSELISAVRVKNGEKLGVLHMAAELEDTTLFFEIMQILPVRDRIASIEKAEDDQISVLWIAVANSKIHIVNYILSLYPESSLEEIVKERSRNGNTLLHIAVQLGHELEIFITLLKLYPVEQRLEALMLGGVEGTSVLQFIDKKENSFDYRIAILNLLSDKDKALVTFEETKQRGVSSVLSQQSLFGAAEHTAESSMQLSQGPAR